MVSTLSLIVLLLAASACPSHGVRKKRRSTVAAQLRPETNITVSPSGLTCKDVWNNMACQGQFGNEECYTCGARIDWLISQGASRELAKQQVASQFVGQCGACAPSDGGVIDNDDYQLVWQDEFNVPGKVDEAKWSAVHAGNGFGNNELQFYTGREENAWISDGTLKIRARREDFGGRRYTSAKLESRVDWLYGKFHVRARLNKGTARGTWPANWMMPRVSTYGGWPRSGEIDIMEHVGYDTGRIHGTVHTLAYHHRIGTQIGGSMSVDVKDWHTYTVDWRPDVIYFSCDGHVYQMFRKESDDSAKWPFNHAFYVILNMAVGGDWGGQRGVDEGAFWGEGQIMEIDWVRVEQKQDYGVPSPTPSPSPSGGCCKWGSVCGDCGNDGTGWCHWSSSNCAACTGFFDATASAPNCR